MKCTQKLVYGMKSNEFIITFHWRSMEYLSDFLLRVHTTSSLQKVITFYDYFSKKIMTFL